MLIHFPKPMQGAALGAIYYFPVDRHVYVNFKGSISSEVCQSSCEKYNVIQLGIVEAWTSKTLSLS